MPKRNVKRSPNVLESVFVFNKTTRALSTPERKFHQFGTQTENQETAVELFAYSSIWQTPEAGTTSYHRGRDGRRVGVQFLHMRTNQFRSVGKESRLETF